MVALGINLGNSEAVMAAVHYNGAIEIVRNELSSYSTPCLVGFDINQRHFGEAAKTQASSNLANTVGSLQRFLGRNFDDKIVQEELKHVYATVEGGKEDMVAKVNLRGKEERFTFTQITAMYLNHLRNLANKYLGKKMDLAKKVDLGKKVDVVISVPYYYREAQRQALSDACKIIDWNCELVSEPIAAALEYYHREYDRLTAIWDADPGRVITLAFVDCGQSSMTTTIAEMSRKKGAEQPEFTIREKAVVMNPFKGSRDIDRKMFEYCEEIFEAKHKIKISGHKKATYRLLEACEKAKKQLSANPLAAVSVESLIDGLDLSVNMNRKDFEQETCKDYLESLRGCINEAIKRSAVDLAKIDLVEVVGCSTRMPAVKGIVSEIFGRNAEMANQQEAIARGCAVLSRAYEAGKNTAIKIIDLPKEEIVVWCAQSEKLSENNCALENDANPAKVLDHMPMNEGHVSKGESVPCESAAIDVGSQEHRVMPAKTHEIKSSLSDPQLTQLREKERDLAKVDEEYIRHHTARNKLEDIIYTLDDKLSGEWGQYALEKEKSALKKLLDDARTMHDDETGMYTVNEYDAILKEYSQLSRKINKRKTEHKNMFGALQRLKESASECIQEVEAADPADAHIPQEGKDRVMQLCKAALDWHAKQPSKDEPGWLYEDCSLCEAEASKRCRGVKEIFDKVMSSPMPQPMPEVTVGDSQPEPGADMDVDTQEEPSGGATIEEVERNGDVEAEKQPSANDIGAKETPQFNEETEESISPEVVEETATSTNEMEDDRPSGKIADDAIWHESRGTDGQETIS